jgi:hypothetical protein
MASTGRAIWDSQTLNWRVSAGYPFRLPPLLDMLSQADSPVTHLLGGALTSQKLPGFSAAVGAYLETVRVTGDISLPLAVPGLPPYRFVMPITPFCESRRPPSDPMASWCQYVATGFNDLYLTRVF